MNIFKISFGLSIIAGFMLCAGTAHAGLITGGTAGAGGGVGGVLTGLVSVTTGAEGAGDFTGSGVNPNSVSLSLDVFQLNTPFEVDFTLDSGAVNGLPFNQTEYAFAVTVNNMLISGKEINGFDISIVNVSPGLNGQVRFDAGFDPRPFATGAGSPLAFELPNLPSQSDIRFGGLSGGGGGIPIAQAQVLNFSIDLNEFGGDFAPGGVFSLRFTANPEPEAILLGSFTLALGGFFVYRRRNKKIEVQTEAA